MVGTEECDTYPCPLGQSVELEPGAVLPESLMSIYIQSNVYLGLEYIAVPVTTDTATGEKPKSQPLPYFAETSNQSPEATTLELPLVGEVLKLK